MFCGAAVKARAARPSRGFGESERFAGQQVEWPMRPARCWRQSVGEFLGSEGHAVFRTELTEFWNGINGLGLGVYSRFSF